MREDPPNTYAAAGFDRATHRRRDQPWLSRARAHAEARLVPVWRSRSLVRLGEPPQALLPRLAELALEGELHFLGERGGAAVFALDLSHLEEEGAGALAAQLAPGAEFVDLRRVGAMLPHDEGALLAYARGLLHWHERHRFCGVCGAPTIAEDAGHVRRCTDASCAAQHFPRTDPATIMLVSDGDSCLLGRKSLWNPGMYSTLAGFLEPGESLEDAVRREVMEEVGVRVGAVRYHSSQPWPFPASLMVGFHAQALTRDITLDREELEDARWFSRAEILRFAEQGMSLPRPDAIARRLIEAWLEGRAGQWL
jgi:NAD+ diphosphatase